MGARTSPGRSIPGNPLAGVLRTTARAARSSRAKVGAVGPAGADGAPGEQGPAGPSGADGAPGSVVLAAVVECDVQGQVWWSLPQAVLNPVVTALAVSPQPYLISIVSVSSALVIFRVQDVYGGAAPVGTQVHVTAVAGT